MRIHQHRQLRLAQHVDEPGRDDHPVRVNRSGSRSVREHSNAHDPAAGNAHIPGVPGRPGAIDDVPVANDEIEFLRARAERQCECEQVTGKFSGQVEII